MSVDLEKLNTAVEFLVNRNSFSETVEQLSRDIKGSQDSFVWAVIDLSSIERELPREIVVSFHTCNESELEEVDCETGEKRVYKREV